MEEELPETPPAPKNDSFFGDGERIEIIPNTDTKSDVSQEAIYLSAIPLPGASSEEKEKSDDKVDSETSPSAKKLSSLYMNQYRFLKKQQPPNEAAQIKSDDVLPPKTRSNSQSHSITSNSPEKMKAIKKDGKKISSDKDRRSRSHDGRPELRRESRNSREQRNKSPINRRSDRVPAKSPKSKVQERKNTSTKKTGQLEIAKTKNDKRGSNGDKNHEGTSKSEKTRKNEEGNSSERATSSKGERKRQEDNRSRRPKTNTQETRLLRSSRSSRTPIKPSSRSREDENRRNQTPRKNSEKRRRSKSPKQCKSSSRRNSDKSENLLNRPNLRRSDRLSRSPRGLEKRPKSPEKTKDRSRSPLNKDVREKSPRSSSKSSTRQNEDHGKSSTSSENSQKEDHIRKSSRVEEKHEKDNPRKNVAEKIVNRKSSPSPTSKNESKDKERVSSRFEDKKKSPETTILRVSSPERKSSSIEKSPKSDETVSRHSQLHSEGHNRNANLRSDQSFDKDRREHNRNNMNQKSSEFSNASTRWSNQGYNYHNAQIYRTNPQRKSDPGTFSTNMRRSLDSEPRNSSDRDNRRDPSAGTRIGVYEKATVIRENVKKPLPMQANVCPRPNLIPLTDFSTTMHNYIGNMTSYNPHVTIPVHTLCRGIELSDFSQSKNDHVQILQSGSGETSSKSSADELLSIQLPKNLIDPTDLQRILKTVHEKQKEKSPEDDSPQFEEFDEVGSERQEMGQKKREHEKMGENLEAFSSAFAKEGVREESTSVSQIHLTKKNYTFQENDLIIEKDSSVVTKDANPSISIEKISTTKNIPRKSVEQIITELKVKKSGSGKWSLPDPNVINMSSHPNNDLNEITMEIDISNTKDAGSPLVKMPTLQKIATTSISEHIAFPEGHISEEEMQARANQIGLPFSTEEIRKMKAEEFERQLAGDGLTLNQKYVFKEIRKRTVENKDVEKQARNSEDTNDNPTQENPLPVHLPITPVLQKPSAQTPSPTTSSASSNLRASIDSPKKSPEQKRIYRRLTAPSAPQEKALVETENNKQEETKKEEHVDVTQNKPEQMAQEEPKEKPVLHENMDQDCMAVESVDTQTTYSKNPEISAQPENPMKSEILEAEKKNDNIEEKKQKGTSNLEQISVESSLFEKSPEKQIKRLSENTDDMSLAEMEKQYAQFLENTAESASSLEASPVKNVFEAKTAQNQPESVKKAIEKIHQKFSENDLKLKNYLANRKHMEKEYSKAIEIEEQVADVQSSAENLDENQILISQTASILQSLFSPPQFSGRENILKSPTYESEDSLSQSGSLKSDKDIPPEIIFPRFITDAEMQVRAHMVGLPFTIDEIKNMTREMYESFKNKGATQVQRYVLNHIRKKYMTQKYNAKYRQKKRDEKKEAQNAKIDDMSQGKAIGLEGVGKKVSIEPEFSKKDINPIAKESVSRISVVETPQSTSLIELLDEEDITKFQKGFTNEQVQERAYQIGLNLTLDEIVTMSAKQIKKYCAEHNHTPVQESLLKAIKKRVYMQSYSMMRREIRKNDKEFFDGLSREESMQSTTPSLQDAPLFQQPTTSKIGFPDLDISIERTASQTSGRTSEIFGFSPVKSGEEKFSSIIKTASENFDAQEDQKPGPCPTKSVLKYTHLPPLTLEELEYVKINPKMTDEELELRAKQIGLPFSLEDIKNMTMEESKRFRASPGVTRLQIVFLKKIKKRFYDRVYEKTRREKPGKIRESFGLELADQSLEPHALFFHRPLQGTSSIGSEPNTDFMLGFEEEDELETETPKNAEISIAEPKITKKRAGYQSKAQYTCIRCKKRDKEIYMPKMPLDMDRRTEWVKRLNIAEKYLYMRVRYPVCLEHFTPQDIRRLANGGVHLLHTALPKDYRNALNEVDPEVKEQEENNAQWAEGIKKNPYKRKSAVSGEAGEESGSKPKKLSKKETSIDKNESKVVKVPARKYINGKWVCHDKNKHLLYYVDDKWIPIPEEISMDYKLKWNNSPQAKQLPSGKWGISGEIFPDGKRKVFNENLYEWLSIELEE